MKKTFFTSAASTTIFFAINTSIFLVLIGTVVYYADKFGGVKIDIPWIMLFSTIFFIIVINAHFAFLGMLSRVVITEDKICFYRILKPNYCVLWDNVKKTETTRQMRAYKSTKVMSVINVTGYDEILEKDVTIRVEYRSSINEIISDCMAKSKEKQAQKINKYFD